MIKAKITGKLNFPNVKFGKELKHIADKIFIPFMALHIEKGKALTGAAYPPLEVSTLKQKKNRKTLIESGKLRRSFRSRRRGTNTVIIDLTADRAEVGESLQIDGVGRRRKKFIFFGINKEMEKRAIDHINFEIRKAIRNGGEQRTI